MHLKKIFKMGKNISPNKITKNTSGDENAESIIDYYMKVGIIKVPKQFKMGTSITTDWFNNLEDKERERVCEREKEGRKESVREIERDRGREIELKIYWIML